MEPELITYRKFDDIVLMEALAQTLDDNEIPYEVEEQSFNFDPALVMSNATTEYAVKIQAADFERVNLLLEENETVNIDGVEKDYYLFGFTDAELMEVIADADEWNPFDTALARKILADRGKAVNEQEIVKIHEDRIEELRQPEASQMAWIVVGYVLAAMGGLLGLFIGWQINSYKKTLPNGERIYGYSEGDRRQGRIIVFIAVIVVLADLGFVFSGVLKGN